LAGAAAGHSHVHSELDEEIDVTATRERRTDRDVAADEPSPTFEGIGAFGWASLFGIALVAFLIVANF
jgi:hypothetical protein